MHAHVPAAELARDRLAITDEHELYVASARLERERGRNRYMGTVVAPHAIDCNGDQRAYSSSRVLMTFLPR